MIRLFQWLLAPFRARARFEDALHDAILQLEQDAPSMAPAANGAGDPIHPHH